MAGLAYDQADRFNMEYADELSPETYEHQNRMIQEAAQKPRSAPQYTP